MKTWPRMVIESERQFRARFKGCMPLDVALNPAMAALRMSRRARKNWGYRLPNQRRAYQALNVVGRRIWVDKPEFFGGRGWRARCATVQKFVEREALRVWYAELPF